MSLNTSSGAYEKHYDPSAPENDDKYYEGYVEIKGKFNKWTRHWCVLKKKNLHFFKDVNTQIRDNYAGYFPLEVPTHIEKKGAKEWSMRTSSRKITLRTQVETLREEWIKGFEQSMKGEKPIRQKYIISDRRSVSPPESPVRRLSSQLSTSGPLPTPSPGPSPFRKVSLGSAGYIMTEEEVKRLTEHAQSIAENVAMNAAEIGIQEELLKDESWYQPSFRREDVEKAFQGKKNGIFVVRDFIDVSTSRNMGYVVSLKDKHGVIRHHKIQNTPDGLQIKGYEEKVFDTLINLLCFFIPSQRNKINLVPYNPSASQADPQDEFYLEMSSPTSNGTSATPTRSRSFNDRALPPVPPAPTEGMARAALTHQRPLPTRPEANGSSPSIPESYVEMRSHVEQKRPLPAPPMTTDGNSTPSTDSYVVMLSPTLTTAGTSMSPPLSPSEVSGYVNMPPPTCVQPSYENVVQRRSEEQPPALPPKRRSASVDVGDSYVILGGEQRPPRPPLRKAHTLGR